MFFSPDRNNHPNAGNVVQVLHTSFRSPVGVQMFHRLDFVRRVSKRSELKTKEFRGRRPAGDTELVLRHRRVERSR